MDFIIKPYISVGDIVFGEKLEDARLKLKQYSFESQTNEFENIIVFNDYYEDLDLIVSSDRNKNIEAIEFFNDPKIIQTVTLNEIDLLSKNFKELYDYFISVDPDLNRDLEMFISFKFGIGIVEPSSGNENEFPNHIIVFKKDYYTK